VAEKPLITLGKIFLEFTPVSPQKRDLYFVPTRTGQALRHSKGSKWHIGNFCNPVRHGRKRMILLWALEG
jgi:hypothetical protein